MPDSTTEASSLELCEQLARGGKLYNFERALAKCPGRWPDVTVLFARMMNRDIPEEAWPPVLDEMTAAFGRYFDEPSRRPMSGHLLADGARDIAPASVA